MNIFKRIFGHIYFGIGIILFVLTMLFVLIPSSIALLFDEPRRAKFIHPFFKMWMCVFLPLVGCRVIRKGKENFKKGENYVVVVNHNSFVDIPVSMPWIPGPNKTLAKIELTKIPLFGIVYRVGSILVNRANEHSRKESFSEMNATLNMGLHLCLYPEGTRNKSKEVLQPFFDGAFVTAIRNQKPIIPAILMGTKEILPMKPKFWAWPKTIHYHFLPAVETKGLSLSDRQELNKKIHGIMKDYLLQQSSSTPKNL